MSEGQDLSAFIVAYERVTGEGLRIIDRGERPDFICLRPNGRRTGIELATVFPSIYAEQQLEDHRDIFGSEPITGHDIAWNLDAAAFEKNEKIRSGNWRIKDNILVLQVCDIPLDQIGAPLKELAGELAAASRFRQVWAAGSQEKDSSSEIDLYCIKPTRWRGLHARPLENHLTQDLGIAPKGRQAIQQRRR